MEEEKDVRPVCKGRGRAFDTDTFEWTSDPCKSCDGTGKPLWKGGPEKKRGQAQDLRRLSIFLIRKTSSFPEYVRECRYAGLNPLSPESYLRTKKVMS